MEEEGIARVKMFIAITVAYLIFWGPLFLVTLFSYGDYKTETPSTSHEVTLHVAFVHAFVNPTLFLVLHKGLRRATIDLLCCNFRGTPDPAHQPYDPELYPPSNGTLESGVKSPASGRLGGGGGGGGNNGNGGVVMGSAGGGDMIPVPISSINRSYM